MLITLGLIKKREIFTYLVFSHSTARAYTNLDVTLQLGINDISVLTDLLICKDSFQNSLVKLQLHFFSTWNNAIGSFGAGTNGDDFTQDTYHT
jgi:hypothetical protein